MKYFLYFFLCAGLYSNNLLAQQNKESIVVGSKNFTENIILAELATQLLGSTGKDVLHQSGMGGSRILWTALMTGEIDIYPEYTGTLRGEIFSDRKIKSFSQLKEILALENIGVTSKLGFNNTYVIGMLDEVAASLDISTISDLKKHANLKFAFSNEFMDRDDGWPGLREHYQLPQQDVLGIDHDLAYRGLQSRAIDTMDLYSTDAEIQYYKIRSLQDDQKYFSDYHAVYLYRLGSDIETIQQLQRLDNLIDAKKMITMNAAAKIEAKSKQEIASAFIKKHFAIESNFAGITIFDRIRRTTIDHLTLVAISLFAAICFAIPLGVVAARHPTFGHLILGISGVLQTIPSLALFVFMIPLLGIGAAPTIVALFIYSLLPIIRNTYSGLHDIPSAIRESAQVIGLPNKASLRMIELPLATRSILAGIKTSAVINIGTATLGAFIGAGGYGQPILAGIRLDDTGLILEGAIPAAVLALLVQLMFEYFERVVLPAPLRYSSVGKHLD